MRNLLLILCLATCHFSSAQDTTIFAPPGATWYYRPWTWGPDTGLYTFTSANDTLLDGWNARVLRCSVWVDGAMHPAESLNKYVATVGNKVFYRVAGEFVLLFDFGAPPGDTISSKVEHFPIFDGCITPPPDSVWGFSYRVDSVATTTIDGMVLRVSHTTDISAGSWGIGGLSSEGAILERIGVFNFGRWWGAGGACVLGGFPGYLRCYQDNDIHFQPPPPGWGSGGACDYVSAPEPVFHSMKITPNPASAMARLPFFPDHIEVFNLLGQKINTPVFGENLDVSLFVPGIYRIIAEKDGRFYVGQLAVCSRQ